MRPILKLAETFLRYVYLLLDRAVFFGFNLGPLRSAHAYKADDFVAKAESARCRLHPEVDNLEKTTGVAIDSDWLHNLAQVTQITCKQSETNYQHGRVLYSMLGNYLADNNEKFLVLFETGSARGFSSIVMSKVLSDNNRSGIIFTVDVLPHEKPIFWSSRSDIDVGKITRRKMLENYRELLNNIIFVQGYSQTLIPKIGVRRINFAFLDGAHSGRALRQEFQFVASRQDVGDMVVIDDVDNSAYHEITQALIDIKNQNLYQFTHVRSSASRAYAIGVRIIGPKENL